MNEPKKYRKKPVVIAAMQWTGENREAIKSWCGASDWLYVPELVIPTLEGSMSALPGDWIIKGVKGEFYPCKPDIFAATYEEVND
jgi:hypothetical protein